MCCFRIGISQVWKNISSHAHKTGFWYLSGVEKHFQPRPQNRILVPRRGPGHLILELPSIVGVKARWFDSQEEKTEPPGPGCSKAG